MSKLSFKAAADLSNALATATLPQADEASLLLAQARQAQLTNPQGTH